MEKHTHKAHREGAAQGDTQSRRDCIKKALALLILAGGVFFYYGYEAGHALLRVGGLLAAIVVSGFLISGTETGRRWRHFLSDMRKELRLVVWPTRPEVVRTTLTIFVVVIIMGIFLWLVDMFFLWAVEWLTGRGG